MDKTKKRTTEWMMVKKAERNERKWLWRSWIVKKMQWCLAGMKLMNKKMVFGVKERNELIDEKKTKILSRV